MGSAIAGRVLLVIGFVVLFMLFAFQAFSEEIQIVEIKKNLQLDSKDPVYRDYYINAGSENGLKSDMTFEVFRKVAINDQYQSSSRGGTILLPVGRVKIIYAQTKLSIGRLQSLNKAKTNPLIDTSGFMVGDVLNISSAELVKEEPVKKQPVKVAKKNKVTKQEPIKNEPVQIIKPDRRIEVSQSVPLEILPIRAPASINPPAPVVKITK